MNLVRHRKPQWVGRFITALLLGLLQACSQSSDSSASQQSAASISYVTPQVAMPLLEQAVQVLDVRTDAEWEAGHLTEAQHWPIAQLQQSNPESLLDPDKPVLVYCKSGGRASKAGQHLVEAGFSQVYVVSPGGYSHLAEAGGATAR